MLFWCHVDLFVVVFVACWFAFGLVGCVLFVFHVG